MASIKASVAKEVTTVQISGFPVVEEMAGHSTGHRWWRRPMMWYKKKEMLWIVSFVDPDFSSMGKSSGFA